MKLRAGLKRSLISVQAYLCPVCGKYDENLEAMKKHIADNPLQPSFPRGGVLAKKYYDGDSQPSDEGRIIVVSQQLKLNEEHNPLFHTLELKNGTMGLSKVSSKHILQNLVPEDKNTEIRFGYDFLSKEGFDRFVEEYILRFKPRNYNLLFDEYLERINAERGFKGINVVAPNLLKRIVKSDLDIL